MKALERGQKLLVGFKRLVKNQTITFEDFATEEVLKGRSIMGLYPATEQKTRDDFAAWRKIKGR